jgi:hypothetical protein
MPELTYRRVSEQGYRISTDGVEIGSVSVMEKHTRNNRKVWHWGVDTMPLLSRPTPPSGDIEADPDNMQSGFEAALAAFKQAFTAWHAQVSPETWRENLEHKRVGQERLARLK